MACLQPHSPALMEVLFNRLKSIDRAATMDHHLFEYGAVKYYAQSFGDISKQATSLNPKIVQLSISTPPLSPVVGIAKDLSNSTMQAIRELCANLVEIVEPTEEGYQLTLRFDFSKFPDDKEESAQLIKSISSLGTMILTSQLREMLRNEENLHGLYRPIKIAYHPREPFFIVRQPGKTTAIFPMNFKDDLDVVIAAALFQELMDVRCSTSWKKAPFCTWSPIPPTELRGEHIQDLITNGGFVSFGIALDTVTTSGGRKTRKNYLELAELPCVRETLCKAFERFHTKTDEYTTKLYGKGIAECKKCGKGTYPHLGTRSLTIVSKSRKIKRSCNQFETKIKKGRLPIKIHGFFWLRRQRR